MDNLKKTILMLTLLFSVTLCYAHKHDRTTREGVNATPIQVTPKLSHGNSDKSGSINPVINGNVLVITFSENLGQVSVEITTIAGSTIDCISALTPNGMQIYIPNAGDYIVNITLPNGDEYYGEFTVTE